MDQGLFLHILSQIKKDKPTVHLQGWGEPLIQKGFLSFVRLLKQEGINTSFTTNGSVMTKNLAEELLESGVDGITFSMAGSCSTTQDELRGAGTFSLLLNSIATFVSARERYHQGCSQIAVSYLLTPETVQELPQAVSWCRRVGVDVFVTVHLTQSAGPVQDNLAFLPSKKESSKYRYLRFRTNTRALFGKMQINMKPFYPTMTSVCDKNPISSLFINANGDVSPCVFHAPPVKNEIAWRRNGIDAYQKALVMGNVNDLTLKEIWESERYKAFREKYKQRREYHDSRLARVSYSLAGVVELETARKEIKEYFASHPVPKQCLACAKTNGY